MKLFTMAQSISGTNSFNDNYKFLNKMEKRVKKYKRYNDIYMFLASVIGQLFILVSFFTALSYSYAEEDWALIAKVPYAEPLLRRLGTMFSPWYLEIIFMILFTFITPILISAIISLPFRFFPVLKTRKVKGITDAEKAKGLYNKACHIRYIHSNNGGTFGFVLNFAFPVIWGIGCGVLLFLEDKSKDFGTLFGSVIGAAFLAAIFAGLGYVLTMISSIIPVYFSERDDETRKRLESLCQKLENQWVSIDKIEQDKRQAEKQKKIEQEKAAKARAEAEERRRKAKEDEDRRISAEAAAWAWEHRNDTIPFSPQTATRSIWWDVRTGKRLYEHDGKIVNENGEEVPPAYRN